MKVSVHRNNKVLIILNVRVETDAAKTLKLLYHYDFFWGTVTRKTVTVQTNKKNQFKG